MQRLLNIVDHPLLEIRQVFGEHSDAGCGLDHDRLVTRSDGLDQIMLKQANDSVRISLRDWAVGFSARSHFLARCAVRYPVPNHNMTRAEHV